MTVKHKLSLGLCILSIGLSLGCSSDTKSRDAGDSDLNTSAVDEIAQQSESSVSANPSRKNLDREQLASRIEKGAHVDLAAIETEVSRIRRDMIIDRYFEKLYDSAVSEADVESYYREHADEFVTREIELAHILIKVPTTATTEQREALNTKARDIAAQLHTGESFSVLAEKFSEDNSTATQGGVIGWVAEHELSDELMASVIELESGTVSTPLVAGYGIHIVKVLTSAREVQRPLAEVRARIAQTLRTHARDTALNQFATAEL